MHVILLVRCSYRFSLQFNTGTSSSTGEAGSATTSKYYDDIYFDSDSEDEDKKSKGLREKTASSE